MIFIGKFNRRLIHVGPWGFFIFAVFTFLERNLCNIKAALCSYELSTSTIRSQNARDTNISSLPLKQSRWDFLFSPRDRYGIDRVEHRFICKNREYTASTAAEDRELRSAGSKSIYGYVSDNEYDLVYAYAERLSPRTRYTNTYIR